MNDPMREMILQIEVYCRKNGIDHRFVGGVSYGGLLNKNTSYQIQVPRREIVLKNHNPLTFVRSDGTIRDIDFVFFGDNHKKITELKRFIAQLKRQVRGQTSQTPAISFEGPIFASVRQPKGFFKFVTVVEVERKGGESISHIFLRFDKVRQEISWKSLEPWTVVLENGMRYTTRNPIADYYAYQFRSPSGVKPKDKEKVGYLRKIVEMLVAAGKKNGIDYYSMDYYQPWHLFTEKLEKSPLPSVQSKRFLIGWYWNTIGTYLAHGKGLVGKRLLAFYNLVMRLRQ